MFVWVSAVPLLISMVKVWMIFTDIGMDRSYSFENAARLRDISRFIMADTLLYAVGSIVLIAAELLHPALFLLFMTLIFIGIIIGVTTSALSQLIYRRCDKELKDKTE